MKSLTQFARFFLVLFVTAILAASCAPSAGCKGGGWYDKNKNLGAKNKPVNYKYNR